MSGATFGKGYNNALFIVIAAAAVVSVTLYSDLSLQRVLVASSSSSSSSSTLLRGLINDAAVSSNGAKSKDMVPDSNNSNSIHHLVPIPTSPPSRLWQNMSIDEQEQALQRVGLLIKKYGQLFAPWSAVHSPWRQGTTANETLTDPQVCAAFGTGWGAHDLCGPAPPQPCKFISFGISTDYTFDVDVANVWNCRGFAGDPSIVHKSQLHPKVTFHNLAAGTLEADQPDWWTASLPSLVKFLRLDYVDVLKMDCEGCEYALPRDILLEDPTFFHRVGQISLEVHVSKEWIKTNETLYYFGLLFELMEEAGLELAWSHITWCSPIHEVSGCMPQLEEWGFSCGLGGTVDNVWPDGNKKGSCHNFLFARRQLNRPNATTTTTTTTTTAATAATSISS